VKKILPLSFIAVSQGAVIIDVPVESSDPQVWSTTNVIDWHHDGSVAGAAAPEVDFSGVGFFTGGVATQEGGTAAHLNPANNTSVTIADLSQGGGATLEAGTYTLQFAVGNYNNSGFPTIGFEFAGITTPTSSTTPAPASGGWGLYELVYTVNPGDAAIGNNLNFGLNVTGAGNASLDGVGDLSNSGTGFVVDFVAIPEPSTTLLGFLGAFGLMLRRR